jgi:hypothetical protein
VKWQQTCSGGDQNGHPNTLLVLACVWYHGGYVGITVTHLDFTEATEYSFSKITVDHCDFGSSTVILNIYLVCLVSFTKSDSNLKLKFTGFDSEPDFYRHSLFNSMNVQTSNHL